MHKIEIIEKISDDKEFREKVSELMNKLYVFNNNLTQTLNAR